MPKQCLFIEHVFSCAAPSAPPSAVVVEASDSRSINVTWDPPPADAINGIISYYVVNVTVQNTKERFHYTVTDTELKLGNLHPYYTYTVVVAAFTVAKGPFSAEFSIITPQDGTVTQHLFGHKSHDYI